MEHDDILFEIVKTEQGYVVVDNQGEDKSYAYDSIDYARAMMYELAAETMHRWANEAYEFGAQTIRHIQIQGDVVTVSLDEPVIRERGELVG